VEAPAGDVHQDDGQNGTPYNRSHERDVRAHEGASHEHPRGEQRGRQGRQHQGERPDADIVCSKCSRSLQSADKEQQTTPVWRRDAAAQTEP